MFKMCPLFMPVFTSLLFLLMKKIQNEIIIVTSSANEVAF